MASSRESIRQELDGEMRVPRVKAPIIGAIAIAVALLVIALYFQSL